MKRSQAIPLSIKVRRRGARWIWRVIGSFNEDMGRCPKWKNFRTASEAKTDAKDYIEEKYGRDRAHLRYTRANMPKLQRGSPITKWGDLEWILHHGDYVYLENEPMSPTQIEYMGRPKLMALIHAGSLFLAVEG